MTNQKKRIAVDLQFCIGEIVYLKVANVEAEPGMLTGIDIAITGPDHSHRVVYYVTWGDAQETQHIACELTTEFIPDYTNGAQP